MGGAFTPGLAIAAVTTVRRTRRLPIRGEVLVRVGDTVDGTAAVASAAIPGTLAVVKAAQALGGAADQVERFCLVREGDRVTREQVLAERSYFFGLFTNRCRSPRVGIVEYISKLSGNIGVRGESLPVVCKAYLAGTVVDVMEGEGVVVEATAALVQGIFGIGGERHGELLWMGEGDALRGDQIGLEHRGKVLLHPRRIDASALRAAAIHGVIGLVGGSMIDAELMDYLGFNIGVAITGEEPVPFSLILTEGFGDMQMPRRTQELLQSLSGRHAAVNGATQIRAGVIRPEIIVPRSGPAPAVAAGGGELVIGTRVRCIRRPNFGALGVVTALPDQPRRIETGSNVRVLSVRLDSGADVTIPRANVEILAVE
jgi:hypothetical protein